jgi:hypothetical protein
MRNEKEYQKALAEYKKGGHTKKEIIEKYHLCRTTFFKLAPPKKDIDRNLRRCKTISLELFMTNQLSFYVMCQNSKKTLSFIAESFFKISERWYKELRKKYLNKASVLLFISGLSVSNIESILSAKRKHFTDICSLFNGKIPFIEFCQRANKYFNEYSLGLANKETDILNNASILEDVVNKELFNNNLKYFKKCTF